MNKERRTQVPRPNQVIERGRVRHFNCAHESHAARMDDYDESERSLSSSTALPLPLLGWYGADLSLKRNRCSCLSRGS